MQSHDVTPKPTPNTANRAFARQFPILAEHAGTPEPLAWERFRSAMLIHDIEHSHRTWLDSRRAYRTWATAFLADGGQAA